MRRRLVKPILPGELTVREQAIFFIPLAMTSFVIIITHSLFNAGLARLPSPEIMIAAFAVAKSLMHIFQSPTMMIRQTITALIDHRKNYRRTFIFLVLVVVIVVVVLGTIAFSGLSRILLREVMGLRGRTLDEAVLMLHILFLFPACVATRDFFAGFAIKFRTTPLITIASVVRITYVFIFISLLHRMTAVPAAYLASLMFIGAVACEAITMAVGTFLLNKSIPKALSALDREQDRPEPKHLTYGNIFSFFTPLIATTLIQTTLMPIINSGLARTDDPDIALSVFAVSWGLGMIFISPFIMFHQIPLNYMESGQDKNSRSVIKFALIMASVCAGGLLILGFTPVGYFILTRLIGASHEISVLSGDVLKLMGVIPFLMVAREYYWGILMKRRTTKIIWKGKAISLVSLIAVITVMTLIGPANPAINGVIGMIGCELAEFLFLFWISKKTETALNQV